jgi:hypothetical protein
MLIPDDSPTTLDYAGPATRPPLMPAWETSTLRSAKTFAFMQLLLLGITVVIALMTGGHVRIGLGFAGVVALLLESPLLLMAAVSLLIFTASRWADAADRRREIFIPAAVGLALNVAAPIVSIGLIVCDGGLR